MEGVKCQVRRDEIVSNAFIAETGLKQRDAFVYGSSYISLEKALRVLRNEKRGIRSISYKSSRICRRPSNFLGDSLDDTARGTEV